MRSRGLETRTPQVRRWDVSATKDLLAAITFLVTGLLFLIAQAGETPEAQPAPNVDCEGAEAMLVADSIQEVPDESGKGPPVTWDS
jgi:hypothetical protein